MKAKLWIMISLASIFQLFMIGACSEKENDRLENRIKNNELIIKGSDSEYELMNALLNDFSSRENGIKFNITGGGSGKGIEALIKNEINIATSSREITPEEQAWADENGVEAVPLIFALDAVAFITHPTTGVDSLSPEQLKMIYSGEITNWKELGGSDLPVVLIGRNEHSGTNGYLFNKLKMDHWSTQIIEREYSLGVYEDVKSKEGSIGYLSLGTIVSNMGKPVSDVWAINVYTDYSASVSPYEIMKVQNGDYYFSRPLYLYFNGEPTENVKKFSDYILSNEIQNTLWNYGYFPITDYQKKINLKKKNKQR